MNASRAKLVRFMILAVAAALVLTVLRAVFGPDLKQAMDQWMEAQPRWVQLLACGGFVLCFLCYLAVTPPVSRLWKRKDKAEKGIADLRSPSPGE